MRGKGKKPRKPKKPQKSRKSPRKATLGDDPRIEVFIHEYVKDLNGAAAARRAGFAPAYAKQTANRLLTNTYLLACIANLQKQRLAEVDVDSRWIMQRLASIADSDIADYGSWGMDGLLKLFPLKQIRANERKAIAEYDTDKDGRAKVKFFNKLPALFKLGDHLGLWKPRSVEAAEALLRSLPREMELALRLAMARSIEKGQPACSAQNVEVESGAGI